MDFCVKRLRTLKSFQIFKVKIKKIKNLSRLIFFSKPIQWYHSHADLIWLDGTFEDKPKTTF
jgi:hypothetical protein